MARRPGHGGTEPFIMPPPSCHRRYHPSHPCHHHHRPPHTLHPAPLHGCPHRCGHWPLDAYLYGVFIVPTTHVVVHAPHLRPFTIVTLTLTALAVTVLSPHCRCPPGVLERVMGVKVGTAPSDPAPAPLAGAWVCSECQDSRPKHRMSISLLVLWIWWCFWTWSGTTSASQGLHPGRGHSP